MLLFANTIYQSLVKQDQAYPPPLLPRLDSSMHSCMRNEQWLIHTRGSYEFEFHAYIFKAIFSIETFFKPVEYREVVLKKFTAH